MNQKVIATIGALLIGTAIISGCGSEKQSEDTSLKCAPSPSVKNLVLLVLAMQALSIIKTETNLAFQIGGRVINKFVNVGDTVQAGQVIAQINGSDTSAQVQMLRVL